MASYEEFRGTGGSLYFLHHQDILTGLSACASKSATSPLTSVTGVVNLQPNVDYEIDYCRPGAAFPAALVDCQRQPVSAHQRLSGDEAFLVVRYEYTPGFDKLDQVPSAVRAITG